MFRNIRSSNVTTYRPTWWVLVSEAKALVIDAIRLERSILCGIWLLSVEFGIGLWLGVNYTQPESLILAQNERWRHA